MKKLPKIGLLISFSYLPPIKNLQSIMTKKGLTVKSFSSLTFRQGQYIMKLSEKQSILCFERACGRCKQVAKLDEWADVSRETNT